ncbi:MAG: sulfite exporter TauE/SafE family protein [Rhodospirillaceae bacterium]|jgi:uncharacterized protein|nr:sulfite exporter TauE/SafE family protein [Rhodospirillaceae bacterium]
MPSTETLIIITVTFLISGSVKGVIGLGLPSVSLALLTATLGLKDAMAIIIIPTFCTNVLQGLVGGHFKFVTKKFASMMILAAIGTWFAAGILAKSEAALLSGLLGLSVCSYAGVSLFTPQLPPPGKHENWLSPIVGAFSGFLTGLTGSFIMPGVIYMQAVGLPRDTLIQAMGVVFTAATIGLAVALGGHDLLPLETVILSTIALIPAFAGMWFGQKVRKRIPEAQFRRVFFIGLLALGIYIIGRALLRDEVRQFLGFS